ncbi:MAG: tandem-95 repeat protein [Thermoplasmata archaeon]|nr:MAG: tandem-95 repeat protein [Thermoplasmata archaeon]
MAGNDLVAGALPNPWSFTTEDVVEPEITSTTPSNGTIDVLITTNIVVTFSEEMNTSSVTFTCTPDPNGWSIVWSGGNTIATYSHNPFASTTTYIFEITGAKDLAGNDLAAGAAPNPWTFTTEDVQGPIIISTTPADGSINIAQSANIIVTFSEAMNISSVNYICSPNPGGWFVSWSSGDTVATFTHNPFDAYTTYTFQITNGKDLIGNDLTSGAVPNPWMFTTIDSIAPSITATSPSNGSANIGLTQNVVVTFSEAMNTSSMTYSCFPDPGGWSVVWSSGDTVATFSHNAFIDSTAYTFLIANAKDVAGNHLAQGSVPNPWTFTTTDTTSPTIILTSPQDVAVDIALTADVVVSFSEIISTASVAYLCTPDPGGWSFVWSAGHTVATFSHDDFDKSTDYTFQIISAKDMAGNNLVAGGIPNPWSFTTVANMPPTILSTPIITATEEVPYTYDVEAIDSDGGTLTYSLFSYPLGMTINSTTGLIIWTPTNSQVGANSVIVTVSDGEGGSESQSFSVTVNNVNDPPMIISTPFTDATEDVQYNYDVDVSDIDGDTLTFSLTTYPAGMVIDDSSGLITWTPTNSQVGVYSVVVLVSDGNGGTDTQSFEISVKNANDAPTITSTPITTATEDELYVYDVEAQDVDVGDTLTFSLTAFPTGMTIDTTSGLVEWTPTNAQVGVNSVTVVVSDENGSTATQQFTITVTNVNDPPTITSIPITAATEDIQYTYDVDASDIDGDFLNYSLSTYPAGMTIDNATGLITWTPSNSQVGNNNVYIIVSDGKAGTDTQSFIISVVNANDAPTITSTPITTAVEDSLYIYDVEANDVDSGDTLTYSLTAYPLGMTIDSATGMIQWTPTNDQIGANGVTALVMDGNGANDTQSFIITVSNTNDAPTVISAPQTTATEDVQYTYDVEAYDPDSDTLTFSLNTYPAGMTINTTTGLITWTPTNSQVGANNVYILVSDGKGGTGTQSFTIFVENANDAPTITSTPITTATEDELYVYDVEVTDVDVGDNLTFGLTAYPMGMTINATTGLIEWTPTNAQVGANPVTLMVSDENGSTDTQSFTITVSNTNNPPDIYSVPITAATEDILYNYDVEAQDPDDDTLTYSLTTYPTGMAIDGPSGLISWTPINSQVGAHSVVVQVLDGIGGTDTQGFTVTVLNTNDPPTITSTPITTATDDVLYTYDVDASDIDVGDTLTYSLTSYPTGMEINSTNGLITWTPTDDHVGSNSITILVSDSEGKTDTQSYSISVADINDPPTISSIAPTAAIEDTEYIYYVEALDPDSDILSFSLTINPNGMTINSMIGLIQWTPTNEQVGANNVVVQVLDGNGGSDTQTFTIFVENVNDAPTIISTPITTATEDELYTYDVDATDIDVGDTLTFSLTEYPTGMSIDAVSGLIEWTPTNNQVGTNPVTVVVMDENGSTDNQIFTITVSNVNDPPSITSTPPTTAIEDTEYAYDVNALDPDNDMLSFSLSTYPNGMTIDAAGLITWTPINDQVGINNVAVMVMDGKGGSDTQTFAITVSNVNDPPTITSTPILTATEDLTYSYDVEADDVDVGDTLTFSLTAYPDGMTINIATGLIEWIPTNAQVGVNPVFLVVSDESGSNDTQSFTITVSNTNDAPSITSTPITAATEDIQYIYDVEASDIDGDSLNYNLSTYPAGMTIDSATGLITWTPTNSDVGVNSVNVMVSDGNGGIVTQTFNITVSNTNDPPTIISGSITTATQNTLYTYDVEATDVDDDTLTFSLTAFPQGMTIDPATGVISWIPNSTQVGGNSVTVEVFDGNSGRDTQSFTITVANVNDQPEFISQPVTIATEETEYFYEVEVYDIDGDILTYSLVNYPNGMTIESATGIITWTPTNAQVGTHSIAIGVVDGNGGYAQQTFTITVSDVNDPPVIIPTPATQAIEEVLYTYQIQAEDQDPADTMLRFELAIYPQGMQINSTTGIINWTPTYAQVGDNPVTVMVYDKIGTSDTLSFNINVANVNDVPIIISGPITTAVEEAQYYYHVNAQDDDFGDTLTYNLTTAPVGMDIDALTNIISWVPADSQVGTHQVVLKVTDNHGASTTQSFYITVENVNDAPELSDSKVSPETGDSKDRYTFTLAYKDPDGDPGAVKLVINGREYEMTKIGGDAVTGAIYSIEMGLGARTHSYYFEIDDGEDHIVVSEVNELSVSAAEKEEEEDLLPIPLWWIILILIIIIVAVLIYLGRVKRQVNRLKRFQQFSEKIDRMQYKKQELGGVEREEMAEKAETKKAGETLESEEPEEEEESEGPLLEFSQ